MKKVLTIIYTSDIHMYINDNGIDKIGFPRLKTYVDTARNLCKESGTEFLFIDGGDLFEDIPINNYDKGRLLYPIIDKMGYDYLFVGNHDYDFGVEMIADRVDNLKTNYIGGDDFIMNLSQPIIYRRSPSKFILEPNDDLRIAIGNVLGDNIFDKLHSSIKSRISIPDSSRVYDQWSFINHPYIDDCFNMLVTHNGFKGVNSDRVILSKLHNIHLCLSGHDHKIRNTIVENTRIISVGKYLRAFAHIDVYKTTENRHVIDPRIITRDDIKDLPEDKELLEMINNLK